MLDFSDSFESSNIKRIVIGEISEDVVQIMFKSSKMLYNYQIKEENWVNSLQTVIDSKESVGKFVNSSIREEKLELISKFLV